ncbi:MAG TPA: tetratricopeptide repeat protein [Verrucomicrobiae bacterium]
MILLVAGLIFSGCKKERIDFAAQAREAEAKGNFSGAIQAYERAIREAPGDLSLRHGLIELLLKESRDEQALPHLMLLVRAVPNDEALLVRTVGLLLQFGGWKESKELYDLAPQAVKDRPAVREMQAELLIREAKLEEALKILAALAAEAQTPPEIIRSARLRQGRVLHQMGRSDSALKEFDALLESDPKDREAALLRANLFMASKKYAEAKAAYEALLLLYPAEHEAWLGLASLAVQEGRMTDAIASYEQAHAINPKDSDVLFWLAELHFERGDKAALADLKNKAQGRKWEKEIFQGYLRALEQMGAGEYKAALKELERLKPMLGGYPGLFDKIGLCYLKLGDPMQAEISFAKLPHDEAMQEQVWSALGRSYLSITNYARAVRWLEVARGKDRIGPLTQAQFGMGDLSSAYKNAQIWLKDEPTSVSARLIAAEAARRLEIDGMGRSHFEQIAVSDPESAAGVYARAQLLVSSNRLNEAVTLLKTGNELISSQAGPNLLLAEIHLRLQEADEAERHLRRTLELDPKNARAYALWGVISRAKGDTMAAGKHFADALVHDASDRIALMGSGYLNQEKENYAQAAEYFERAANLKRPEVEAALLWSLAEFARDNFKRALQAAELAVKLSPTNAFARYLEVRGNMMNSEWPRARKNATELSTMHPGYAPAEHARALLALSTNGVAPALAHVQKGLQLQSTNLLLQPLEVELLRAMGQTNQARERLDRLKHDFPDEPDRYLAEVNMLMDDKDFEGARRLSLEGLKKAASEPRLQQRVLDTFVQTGMERDAAPVMEEVLKLDPENAALRFICGRLREVRGDWSLAENHYRTVLEKEPQNVATLNNLSLVIARDEKKLDEAAKLAQRAYVLDSRNPAVADTYATLLLARGDSRQAVTLLEDARKRAPNSVEIRLHLVEALLAKGAMMEARLEFDLLNRELPAARNHSRHEAVSAKLELAAREQGKTKR